MCPWEKLFSKKGLIPFWQSPAIGQVSTASRSTVTFCLKSHSLITESLFLLYTNKFRGSISSQEVTKQYAQHTALDKVSITILSKTIFGLLGPNGAGKTTLIRIINQIINSDSGEITIFGEKLKSKHVEMIGYLPRSAGFNKK